MMSIRRASDGGWIAEDVKFHFQHFDTAEEMCQFVVNKGLANDDELDKAILYMAATNNNTAHFTIGGMFSHVEDVKD